MEHRDAIVYLRALEPDEHSQDADPAVEGIDVVHTVRDESGDRRAALAEALGRVGAGEASTLVLARLRAAVGSLRELVALLDWLGAAGADLVACDVGLDTGTRSGRRIAALLREIDRWEREPESGRPPRGRPGLADRAPELAERISELRGRGMSLQAIADALNDEGVPTPRGGAQWRPSSVQAALGYRRPRPPAPGAPPPPPGRPGAGRPGHRPPPRAPGGPHPGRPRP